MFHTETEMTLAIALQTDCERLVRAFSVRMARQWLDLHLERLPCVCLRILRLS